MIDSTLKVFRASGFEVSVHRVDGIIEMHAVNLANPDEQHISRVINGDGPDESYRCACELAQMVGIELSDNNDVLTTTKRVSRQAPEFVVCAAASPC